MELSPREYVEVQDIIRQAIEGSARRDGSGEGAHSGAGAGRGLGQAMILPAREGITPQSSVLSALAV